MTKRPLSDFDDSDLRVVADEETPRSFSWRGHRYVVESIVMHWVESGAWWQALRGSAALFDPTDFDVTWHIWRVEARSVVGGLVGDLALRVSTTSTTACPWRLVRVFD